MEIVFNTEKLQSILNFLILGVETAVLSSDKSKMFYFKTVDKKLYIFTSSDEIALSALYGDVEVDMNICFDASKLKHLITKTKTQTITFYHEEGIWKIKGKGNYTLENFTYDSADNFYMQPVKQKLFELEASEFTKAMEKSIFFTSDEREAPHLRNFYFDGNIVSTDRKSCQVVTTSIQKGSLEKEILIPQVFYEVCQKVNTIIQVYNQETFFILIAGDFRIRLPEISGIDKFPDYQAFLDKCEAYAYELSVDKKEFLETLERVTYFTDKGYFYKIGMEINSDKINITSKSNDELEESVSCTANQTMKFYLNGQYLQKSLEILENPITIKYQSPDNVLYLKDKTSRLILLPLVISE